jgi:regulatory protein
MLQENVTILSVRQSPGDLDHCWVTFNNETTLRLHIDIVVSNSLTKGKILSTDEFEKITKQQRISDVRIKAYKYASGKDKTEFMIARNLKQKGFQDDEIEIALEYLREYELINDKEFCKKYIQSSLKRKPSGRLKLMNELLKRGVKKYVIEDSLNSYFPEENLYDMALQAAQKKLRLLINKPSDKAKASLINSLKQQGFPNNIIWEVIKNLNSSQ